MTDFVTHDLGDGLGFRTGALTPELVWDVATFEVAWRLHPEAKPHHPNGREVVRDSPVVARLRRKLPLCSGQWSVALPLRLSSSLFSPGRRRQSTRG